MSLNIQNDTVIIGNLIHLRKQEGFSKQDVANYLNMDVIDYVRLENSNYTLSDEIIKKLATLYKVDVDFLLNDGLVNDKESKFHNTKNYNEFLQEAKPYNKVTTFLNKYYLYLICGVLVLIVGVCLAIFTNKPEPFLISEVSRNYLDANNTRISYIDSNFKVNEQGDLSYLKDTSLPGSKIIMLGTTNENSYFLTSNRNIEYTGILSESKIQELTSLNNIVSIATSDYSLIALSEDGKLHYIGDNQTYKKEIEALKNIKFLQSSNGWLYAVNDQDQVYIIGDMIGRSNIEQLTNLKSITSSDTLTAYIREDNSVGIESSISNNFDLSNFKDIVSIICGDDFIVGLNSNNQLVYTGNNSFINNEDFLALTNIKAISAGKDYFVCLLNNNQIVGFGNNSYNQFVKEEKKEVIENEKMPTVNEDKIHVLKQTIDTDGEISYNLMINLDVDVVNEYSVSVKLDSEKVMNYTLINDNSITVSFNASEITESFTVSVVCKGKDGLLDSDATEIQMKINEVEEYVKNTVSIPDLTGKSVDEIIAYLESIGVSYTTDPVSDGCTVGQESPSAIEVSGYEIGREYTKEEIIDLMLNIRYCLDQNNIEP